MNAPYSATPSAPQLIRFQGGGKGQWRVASQSVIAGEALAPVDFIAIDMPAPPPEWTLSGVVSNLRYTTAHERASLVARQAGLGRTGSRHAALIPIRKSPAWWALAQDERRAIYESSAHTPIGLEYLPAIARRLHHSRDLGEPFDFLTWFEFAPEEEPAFDNLLARLRATEEWRYVDREIDIRLTRVD
jgi:chlorite dismutase